MTDNYNGPERRKSVSNWAQIATIAQSVVVLAGLLVGGLTWGIKLESRIDVLLARVEAQDKQLARIESDHAAMHKMFDDHLQQQKTKPVGWAANYEDVKP